MEIQTKDKDKIRRRVWTAARTNDIERLHNVKVMFPGYESYIDRLFMKYIGMMLENPSLLEM